MMQKLGEYGVQCERDGKQVGRSIRQPRVNRKSTHDAGSLKFKSNVS